MLLALHAHILAAAAPAHRAARLGALHALLALLGERAAFSGTAHYAGAVLLQLLPEPAAQPAACALLEALLRRVLAVQVDAAKPPAARATAAALLGSLLRDAAGALAGAVEAKLAARRRRAARERAQGVVIGTVNGAGAAAIELPADDPAVALLAALLSDLPRAPLRAHLRSLEPPPPLRALRRAAAALAAARAGVGLAEEVATFASRAADMAPAARRRALASLRAALAGREAELLLPALEDGAAAAPGGGGGDGGQEGGAAGRLRPEVAEAAWRLARVGAEQDDAGVSEVAAQLLAAAGPLPPDVITLSGAAGVGVGGGIGGGDAAVYMSAAAGDDEGAAGDGRSVRRSSSAGGAAGASPPGGGSPRVSVLPSWESSYSTRAARSQSMSLFTRMMPSRRLLPAGLIVSSSGRGCGVGRPGGRRAGQEARAGGCGAGEARRSGRAPRQPANKQARQPASQQGVAEAAAAAAAGRALHPAQRRHTRESAWPGTRAAGRSPPWRSRWRVTTPSIQYRLPKPASQAVEVLSPGTSKPMMDLRTCRPEGVETGVRVSSGFGLFG